MSDPARAEQVKMIFEDKLERKELVLPLLPQVAAMVIQLSSDPEADAQQLSKLIQGDQALAGHVMRIANSPIYRPVTAFVSLQQAIARLGIITIGEISLATSLNSDLFSAPGSEKLLKTLWHDALTCSAWSREIARMRRTNVESSFLAGLLCQIGKPVVVQGVAEFDLSSDANQALLEQYYVRAGALLANIWQLPEIVGHVILRHCELQYRGDDADVVLNVQAALSLAKGCAAMELCPDIQEGLNFYPEDLENLEGKREVVDAWVNTMNV
ncbi:MAG: HDOD domain-containing protein [Pseudomonadales bacterium]|nr:HDOD domain-containing protein [Pseudomonadales bacterium]